MLEIDKFILIPESKHYVLNFYQNFVRGIEEKLNKLSLVAGIGQSVAEVTKSVEFLLELADRVNDEMAGTLARALAAYYQVARGEYEKAESFVTQPFENLDTMDKRVSSAVYKVRAEWYRVKRDYTRFYRTTLLYLSCGTGSGSVRDLTIAALLSEDIYSFGDLLMHPIMTPEYAVVLSAFNEGRVDYQITDHELKTHSEFLKQKMSLMALVDLVTTNRQPKFEEIFIRTQVQNVEMLVMHAMSLNLIKGKIDEIQKTIYVEWVMPRILDRNQVKQLIDHLSVWQQRIDTSANHLLEQEII